MDEFRENGRLRGALDASLSGLNGDPYLARRLIACAEKQPKAVRKRSIGLAFAFVALLAAVSVAAAAALNLFEQFGQSERRFAEIAPQTVIDSETASIQTERTGTVTASIANAYYDGESLLIGYTIQGNTSFEPFSPTAKELTHMQPTDDVPDWLHAKTGDSALAKAWENAKQAGMPWGVVRYRVSASDHTYTDDGLDLGHGRKQRTLPTRTSFPPSAILTPCRKPRRSETPSPSALTCINLPYGFISTDVLCIRRANA